MKEFKLSVTVVILQSCYTEEGRREKQIKLWKERTKDLVKKESLRSRQKIDRDTSNK